MFGSPKELGGTVHHSFVHVIIPSDCFSPAHYHKISEETYYILKGKTRMIIDDKEFFLYPSQACLIMPNEIYQIFNDEKEDLEFLTISAPAWTPANTYLK